MITTRKRLDPTVFDLPVEKMRAGWYTDAYFNHTREALRYDGRKPRVLMQVFQKSHSYLGGMDEALAILKLCADDYDALTVHALYDGDAIAPYETVLTIEGDYTTFAHLETVYLGTLARRTLITTNVVNVLRAANGKHVIFMPARHDHHRVQTGDGYAAYVAGQIVGAPVGVTTDEQASWWGGTGLGTVPHALIASYGGDTVAAAKHFADWAPADMNLTVLVDFENDSVRTALDVAHALGPRLWGVRLDTSESLVDRSLWSELGDFKPTGVNPRLVGKVRRGARRRRLRPGAHRRLRRLHRRQDPRVRGERRAGRRVRRRLVADPRLERLHRRHRAHRWTAVREVRAQPAAEPAARARLVRQILWDVDTQCRLRPRRRQARRSATHRLRCPRWRGSSRPARAAGIPHVASADDHELTDAEISETPDYALTYPPHCLRGTRGAEKIPETQQDDPVPLALTDVPERWLQGREFLLLKKHFDVFTNPNADRVLDAAGSG